MSVRAFFLSSLFFAIACQAYAVNIGDINALAANSTVTPFEYSLKFNDYYVITGPIDTLGRNLAFSGSTMEVDATGMTANGFTTRNLSLASGSSVLTGGSAANIRGISANNVILSNWGTIDATGGSAAGANGLFASNLAVAAGAVTGNGGSGAAGVHVTNQFLMAGSGMAYGNGGASANSYGMETGSFLTQRDSYAQVTGNGGTGNNAYGIKTGRFESNSGYVYGNGGDGNNAYGIEAADIILASDGGQMRGQGGGVGSSDSYGIHAASIRQSGYSILSGSGGEGTDAYGIGIDGTWTVSNPYVYDAFNGGEGQHAVGIRANVLDFDGSVLVSYGGGGVNAAGVEIVTTATQRGGEVSAYAGGSSGAHGISALQAYNQLGGELYANGGDDYAYGLNAGNYTLAAGATATAKAGYTDHGYGINVGNTMTINGRLELERDAKLAASVYVNSNFGNAVTIGSTAVIAPVVHLTGGTNLDSGLIATAGGNVAIQPGARVDPYFFNSRHLHVGDIEEYVFIDTGALQGGTGTGGAHGQITGNFVNESGGMAIEYVLYRNDADGQYLISFGRVLETAELISIVPCENARRIMDAFDDIGNPNDGLAMRVLSDIDNANTRMELYRMAAHIGHTLTPTAYAKLTGTQLRSVESLQNSVFRRLDGFSDRWGMWAEGLHLRSNHFSAKCMEFDAPKERITGVSLGVGRSSGPFAVTGAFGYARSTYKSDYTDTGVNNFGLTVGAKWKDGSSSGNRFFNPWLAGVAGYVYGDIDQKVISYTRNAWKRSSPSAHMARVSLEAGNDIVFGALTVAPVAGLDYACIRQGGYVENDPDGYGLRVRGDTYHSLRPRIGLEASVRVGDRLDLGVNGQYRYETLDKRSSFSYARLSMQDVVLTARGEVRKRFSGSVGATGRYRVNDRVSLWGEYDVLLEDGYAANRFALGIGVEF